MPKSATVGHKCVTCGSIDGGDTHMSTQLMSCGCEGAHLVPAPDTHNTPSPTPPLQKHHIRRFS